MIQPRRPHPPTKGRNIHPRAAARQRIVQAVRMADIPIHKPFTKRDPGRAGIRVAPGRSGPILVEWRSTPKDQRPLPDDLMLRVQGILEGIGFETRLPYGRQAQLLVGVQR